MRTTSPVYKPQATDAHVELGWNLTIHVSIHYRRHRDVLFFFASAIALASAAITLSCLGDDPDNVVPQPASDGALPDSAAVSDAGNDATSTTDTGPKGCNPTKAFNLPTPLLGGVNTPVDTEKGLTLTADELHGIYAASSDAGVNVNSFDLYETSRSSLNQDFAIGSKTTLATVNTVGVNEADPTLSADGKTLVFTRSTIAGGVAGARQLFATSRMNVGDPFGPVQPLDTLAPPQDQQLGTPYLTFDAKNLYFSMSSGPNSSTFGIYAVNWPNAATKDIESVFSINLEYSSSPVLDSTQQNMFFTKFPGAMDASSDIYRLNRSASGQPWNPNPILHAELSIGNYSSPSWLSPDGCRLYMTRYVTNDNGDIYVAIREPD